MKINLVSKLVLAAIFSASALSAEAALSSDFNKAYETDNSPVSSSSMSQSANSTYAPVSSSKWSGTVQNSPGQGSNAYWEFGGNLGANFFYGGTKGETLQIDQFETDTLTENSRSHIGTLSVYALRGYVLPENAVFNSIGIGPAFYYQHVTYKGVVNEFGSPQFQNFDYRLTNNNFDLLLQAKVNFHPFLHNHISPFVVGGIGGALSATNKYDEVGTNPNDNRVGDEINLDEKKNVNFAAAGGLGVDVMLTENLSLNLQDIFMTSGSIATGTTQNQQYRILNGIKIASDSQNVLFGISYRLA